MEIRSSDARAALSERVVENVDAIYKLTEQHARSAGVHQLRVERAARAIGRPATLSCLVVAAIVWIVVNGMVLRYPLDPAPFFWLQGTLALYAAVVSTLVLVAQARLAREADQRAHLELHVNLLAEQKATKIISLLEELRRDLPNVRNRVDPSAEAFRTEVDPQLVDEALRSRRDG